MIGIPYFDSNNQHVPRSMGGTNNCKFSLNDMGIGFLSDHVCAKALPLIVPLTVYTLEFGSDSA